MRLGTAGFCALAAWIGAISANAAPLEKAPADPQAVLATFDGGRITLSDFEATIANEPPRVRRHHTTPAGRLALLRELENYELLILEARRRGYGERRAVAVARRQAAVNLLLDTLRVDPDSIPEAEVERTIAEESRPGGTGFAWSRAKLLSKMRQRIAAERAESAREGLLLELFERYRPEVFAELVDTLELAPLARLDRPLGFPPFPSDPRAGPTYVEPEF